MLNHVCSRLYHVFTVFVSCLCHACTSAESTHSRVLSFARSQATPKPPPQATYSHVHNHCGASQPRASAASASSTAPSARMLSTGTLSGKQAASQRLQSVLEKYSRGTSLSISKRAELVAAMSSTQVVLAAAGAQPDAGREVRWAAYMSAPSSPCLGLEAGVWKDCTLVVGSEHLHSGLDEAHMSIMIGSSASWSA